MTLNSPYVSVVGSVLFSLLAASPSHAQIAPLPPVPGLTAQEIPSKVHFPQFVAGEVVFTPRVELRSRYEYRHDFSSYLPLASGMGRGRSVEYLRTRLGLAADYLWIGAFVEGVDGREFNNHPDGSGALKTQEAAFDLHQAYVEIKQPGQIPISLRLGRQGISLGSKYLVDAPAWNNKLRSFDMARLTLSGKRYQVDGFIGRIVEVKDGFDRWKSKELFSGIFSTITLCAAAKLDAYFLDLFDEVNADPAKPITGETTPAGAGTKGDENRMTTGGRLHGSLAEKKLDYELEFAYQFGKRASDKIRAFATHSSLGYKIPAPLSPKIRFDHAYASGDKNNQDGRYQTFKPLFGTTHSPFGQIDFFRWQNIHTTSGIIQISPLKPLEIMVEYDAFWLASIHDKWVTSSGDVVGKTVAVGSNKSSFAGQEIDVKTSYTVRKEVKLEAGYAHFIPGDFLVGSKAEGTSADWVYLQLWVGN
jgi:hypothetical protein